MIHKPPLLMWKALEFFIENPYKEIYLREFSRVLKISPNTAQRFLDIFLKEGLIIEERKANIRYAKANLDNIVFRFIKKTHALKKIKDRGLITALQECSSVVLFGSTAKGLDDKKSDIDLVCIGNNKSFEIEKLQEKIKRKLNVHIFSLVEWKKQKQMNKAFYQDVIADGINIVGEMPIID